MAMIHASARAVLVEDSLDMLMSFVDFLYAFQVQLFYHSSLAALEEEFGRQRDVAGGALPVVGPRPSTCRDARLAASSCPCPCPRRKLT